MKLDIPTAPTFEAPNYMETRCIDNQSVNLLGEYETMHITQGVAQAIIFFRWNYKQVSHKNYLG